MTPFQKCLEDLGREQDNMFFNPLGSNAGHLCPLSLFGPCVTQKHDNDLLEIHRYLNFDHLELKQTCKYPK